MHFLVFHFAIMFHLPRISKLVCVLALLLISPGIALSQTGWTNVKSGAWEGKCSHKAFCLVFYKGGERAQRIGAMNIKNNFRIFYIPFQNQDTFKIDFGLYFTPPDFRFIKSDTYIQSPTKKIFFKDFDYSLDNRGGSPTASLKLKRSDPLAANLLYFLSKENTAPVHIAYKTGGRTYRDVVNISLSGSNKVISTVYGNFDKNGPTFRPPTPQSRSPSVARGNSAGSRCSLDGLGFNWCAITGNPNAIAFLAAGAYLYGNVVAPMAEEGARIVGKYSCSLRCRRLGGDETKASVVLRGVDANQAYDHVFVEGSRICRETFGSGWSNTPILPGIDCRLK